MAITGPGTVRPVSLETYRLGIEPIDGGLDADVYADDLIEESTHVSCDDYAVELTDADGDRNDHHRVTVFDRISSPSRHW
ncbi:hypothetical protein [Halosolutus halophilus]|uniref:hypothetical protein n=1 Tax=Halosolutus halophilus TaxID=1552990 RepID=UPI0022350653|nr:hypothetical protein [Halosolutus halophilus]